jgi:hypothetical protein
VVIWPIFDLPAEPQTFRPRLDGQDAACQTSDEGFYEYVNWTMQGWTGGWNRSHGLDPAEHYVVELVDSAGNSWGKSAPLAIPAGGGPYSPSGQIPGVVFANFDGQTGSWNIDPATQDADTATDEITVTNLLGADVVVERCTIADGERPPARPSAPSRRTPTCARSRPRWPRRRPTTRPPSFHLASDASQSYQRDLVQGADNFGFGLPDRADPRPRHATDPRYSPTGTTGFAMSTATGTGMGRRERVEG